MIFEIEVGGRSRRVTIDSVTPVDSSGGGRFRVTMASDTDDTQAETCEVDARPTDLGLLLRWPDGTVVDAAVTERTGGEVLVQLPHLDLPAVVDGRRRQRPSTDTAEVGDQRISAPMPGRVLRVFAAVGDEVAAGQAVVVIEAMKMENDLKVLRAGRVREVLVAEGVSVEAGRLLVVVE